MNREQVVTTVRNVFARSAELSLLNQLVRVLVPEQFVVVVHVNVPDISSVLMGMFDDEFRKRGHAGISYVFTCGEFVPRAWLGWAPLSLPNLGNVNLAGRFQDILELVAEGKMKRSAARLALAITFGFAERDAARVLEEHTPDVPLRLVPRESLEDIAVWLDREEQQGSAADLKGAVITLWQQRVAAELARRAGGDIPYAWPGCRSPLELCVCAEHRRCDVHDAEEWEPSRRQAIFEHQRGWHQMHIPCCDICTAALERELEAGFPAHSQTAGTPFYYADGRVLIHRVDRIPLPMSWVLRDVEQRSPIYDGTFRPSAGPFRFFRLVTVLDPSGTERLVYREERQPAPRPPPTSIPGGGRPESR